MDMSGELQIPGRTVVPMHTIYGYENLRNHLALLIARFLSLSCSFGSSFECYISTMIKSISKLIWIFFLLHALLLILEM
jgi:hypothetical protein